MAVPAVRSKVEILVSNEYFMRVTLFKLLFGSYFLLLPLPVRVLCLVLVFFLACQLYH